MRAIITFHGIDESGSVISYPPRLLAELLDSLRDASLPVLDLDSLLAPGKPNGVALTFDDGMRSVFTHALPVLRDHAAPAHLFLTTGMVGGKTHWDSLPGISPEFDMLAWDEVEKLHDNGIRIEAHTQNHPDMRELDDEAIANECGEADRLIEQKLGRRPLYFAYPFGYRNTRATNFARQHYRASVTTSLGVLSGGEDLAALPRLDSYYLRAPWTFRRLDGVLPQTYLSLRGFLRRLRGRD